MHDHGVEYSTRRERAREHVLAMQALWSTDEASFTELILAARGQILGAQVAHQLGHHVGVHEARRDHVAQLKDILFWMKTFGCTLLDGDTVTIGDEAVDEARGVGGLQHSAIVADGLVSPSRESGTPA